MEVPRKPTSLLGRLTWHLHNPLVAVAAAGALVASYRGLPLQGADTYVDRLIGRPIQVQMGGGSTGVYLLRHGDDPKVEFQIINPIKESWDRLGPLFEKRPADLLGCGYNARIIQRGMWYPANELAKREVVITSFMPDESMNHFEPGELARARKVYLEWLASPAGGNAPGEAALVANGDLLENRMVMSAELKNLGTILAAGVLLLSVWGLPRYVRVWLAGRWVRRGLCGVCKYDLGATAATSEGKRCPECGAVWAGP